MKLLMMARKRSRENIEEITDVDRPIASTKIHGAITSLSPIKKGRKSIFFDGTLADATSKIRVVGFDAHQQRKLQEYHQKNVAAELENCEVKSSRYGDGYELMLKSGTGIKESPKKINVPVLMEEKMAGVPKSITVDGISRMEVFQKVTVNVKVLEVKETVPVAGKRTRHYHSRSDWNCQGHLVGGKH